MNCRKRIGFIKLLTKKYFYVKQYVYEHNEVEVYVENVFFCSSKCLGEFGRLHPEIRLLN